MTNLIGDRYKPIECLSANNKTVFITYLAEDIRDPERKCIVKTIHNLNQNQTRFEEIRQILSSSIFKENINLCQLRDWKTTDNVGYLVFDYVEGVTLKQKITSDGKLNPDEVERITIQLLESLQSLHQAGFVHNDIKPSNIIIRSQDSQVSIIDFDAVSDLKSQSQTPAYTKGYAPPEQKLGHVSVQNDLYALGITAIEILIGQKIHSLERKTNGEIILPRNLATTDYFRQVLLGLTHANRNQRYDSCEQALAELEETEPTVLVVPDVPAEYFDEDIAYEDSREGELPFFIKVTGLILLVSVSSIVMGFIVTNKIIGIHFSQPPVPKSSSSPAIPPKPKTPVPEQKPVAIDNPSEIKPTKPIPSQKPTRPANQGQWFQGTKPKTNLKPNKPKPVPSEEAEQPVNSVSEDLNNLDSGQWFQ